MTKPDYITNQTNEALRAVISNCESWERTLKAPRLRQQRNYWTKLRIQAEEELARRFANQNANPS